MATSTSNSADTATTWSPPEDFRLSFGWIYLEDAEKRENLKNADYARLMLYKTCMENIVESYNEQLSDDVAVESVATLCFSLPGLTNLFKNLSIKNRASAAINSIDEFIKDELTKHDNNVSLLTTLGIDQRRTNGDIIKGDWDFFGSEGEEDEQTFYANYTDKADIYIARANYAKSILEPASRIFTQVNTIQTAYNYWRQFPSGMNIWVGNHRYHGGVSPLRGQPPHDK